MIMIVRGSGGGKTKWKINERYALEALSIGC